MTESIAEEIQTEQERGRVKYGSGPNDLAHDDGHTPVEWTEFMSVHLKQSMHRHADRREELVKIAGLAVSAIEALDRQAKQMSPIDEAIEAMERRRHL